MRTAFLLAIAVSIAAAAAAAQTPAPAAPATPAGQSAAKPAAKPETGPTPAEGYTYQPDGRRDPFLSLIGTGSEPRGATGQKNEGAAGLTVGEISVRGVLESRGALIAMVEGGQEDVRGAHGRQVH